MFYDSHLLFLASLIGCHAMYQAFRDNSFMHYLYINNNHVLDEENKGLIERNNMKKREREMLNLENKKYISNKVIYYKTEVYDFLLNS